MAEVVGLVASVITLCGTVSGGIAIFTRVARAPHEVHALQEQLQIFQSILQMVKVTVETSPQAGNATLSTLERARGFLAELDDIFANKLIKTDNGDVRRTMWLRYHRRIASLGQSLREVWEALWMALGMDLILANRRIEATLEQMRVVSYPADQVKETLHIDQPSSKASLDDSEEPSTVRTVTHGLHNLGFALQQRTAPTSILECSSAFMPEMYTVQESELPLYSYGCTAELVSDFLSIYRYYLVYRDFHNARRWLPLILSVAVAPESSLKFMPLGLSVTVGRNPNLIPGQLLVALRDFLKAFSGLSSYTNIGVRFVQKLSDADGNRSSLESVTEFKIRKAPADEVEYARNITSWATHLNCPRIPEKDIIQQSLFSKISNLEELVYFNSRWVWGLRFGTAGYHLQGLYILRVLHCLNGSRHINPLIGVVVNESDVVTGLLAELPAKGRIFDVYESESSLLKQPIQDINSAAGLWRREKWFQQVVRGVAQFHSKGFVVGSFGPCVHDCPVAVTADDDAVLYHRFREDIVRHERGTQSMSMAASEGTIPQDGDPATFSTDIFDLGLTLWWIATGRYIGLGTWLWCQLAGCPARPGECSHPHTAPVKLPPVQDELPSYMNRVIAACRAPDPARRPAVWQLVSMMPSLEEILAEHATATATVAIPRPTRPEDCRAWWRYSQTCDFCSVSVRDHGFICSICEESDFDICLSCLNQGSYCYDRRHELREQVNQIETGRYYKWSEKGDSSMLETL